MDSLKYLGELLAMVLYAVVISLPGIGVAYFGWNRSRGWHSSWAQTFFRACLIAVAATSSVWGHAGILPAILLTVVLTGREKLAGIIPMLIVWIVALPVIGILAKRRGDMKLGQPPLSRETPRLVFARISRRFSAALPSICRANFRDRFHLCAIGINQTG
jgi:hypothetical protein